MDATRRFLQSIGLPPGDLGDLPSSDKRFPDGAEPEVYPAGTHQEATTVALSRERVRRARLGMELLERSGYEPKISDLGAEGLAVPLRTDDPGR